MSYHIFQGDNRDVITRKEHQCWGCAGWRPKGSTMRHCVNVEYGKFNHSYFCEECEDVAQKVGFWDDQRGGCELGAIRENYGEYFKQEESGDEEEDDRG